MKNLIGGLSVELDNDTIMIRDSKTSELIQAKVVSANDAVDTYMNLVKVLKEKHAKRIA
jgi:hypothetical protein